MIPSIAAPAFAIEEAPKHCRNKYAVKCCRKLAEVIGSTLKILYIIFSMEFILFKRKLITLITVTILFKIGVTSARAVIVDLPVGDQESAKKKRVCSTQLPVLDEVIQSRITDSNGFPFWEHVGMVGMGSGVYLGDGYVLTSAHVGCYPFRMADGSHYKPDYQSWTILKDGAGGRSDLAIFRVTCDKDSALARLGRLPIASSSPNSDSQLLLFGSGLSQSADPNTLKSNGKILAVLGYRLQGQRETTWGFNTLSELPGDPVKTGEFNTHCFVTQFDRSGFEAQAADGDSGGASFVFNAELKRWELAGCIIGVTQKGTYIPFGSRTFLANLSRYRDQLPLTAEADHEDLLVASPNGETVESSVSPAAAAVPEVRSAAIAVQMPD